ncbi:sigma-54-dependent Fis family transcriptional regulator, partial [bacterium]|nr:sigma-54-dependent Fis family transcriptional regulator [bacterium]
MSDYRILIADDEPAQVKALAGFLNKRGYTVLTADSGKTALNIVHRKLVDLVLTDFRMPDLDGLELLKQARELNPEIDVIMMTAFGSIESATDAMRHGAVDYLTKPVDLEQLQLIIERTLEHKMLVSENRLLKQELAEKFRFDQMISVSEIMESAL